ncbi:hypothetical protein CCY99_00225 [Helicobacter sp. 16-1353]|uniref:DUF302 domain-containing protein n=1 Tax=Helicobacter sp. 16-1353 TaxID=2004996 RepID=UPI000DCC8444|nr:DUF302 domain-containing protein [Helicobacter sp. 16-1353]RAX55160.1 hypothetical protein CCY99_00225 [Helicobacter sp. 16-1353]
MKIIKLILSMFIIVNMANAMDIIKSKYDFDTTYKNIKNTIVQKNIPIFAEFDHAKNAEEVGLELNPTSVIVFGNPKVGTFLMQENQSIAIHLPLRISVWKDAKNNVFVTYTDIKDLAKQYNIKNTKVVDNVDNLLKEMVRSSTQEK